MERIPAGVAEQIARSGYLRPGFAEHYDACRPQPPPALVALLTQFAGIARPRLVVDLGSGTGLSTRLWAGHAEVVVGVEPNPAMRREAQARTAALGLATTVRYRAGHAARTGLPNGAADLVTCAQAFHWMEPTSTLAEVARLLRPGGVFAAYDYDVPPAVHWEVDRALAACFERALARVIATARARRGGDAFRPKEEHLAQLRDSGHFRYTREVLLHAVEAGDAARLVGLALSTGRVERALAEGASAEELGLPALREAADRVLGPRPQPWYIGYRIRLAVK
jgi:SAM-dependent methyltransferase